MSKVTKFQLTKDTTFEELKAIPKAELQELKYHGLGQKVADICYDKTIKNRRNNVYDVWSDKVQNDKVWKATLVLLKKKYLGETPNFNFIK